MGLEDLPGAVEIVVRGDEEIALDPGGAGAGRIAFGQCGGTAVDHAGHAHRMLSMIRALKFHHLWPARGGVCDAKAEQGGFRPGGHQAHALGARGERGDAFRELDGPSVERCEVGAVQRRGAGGFHHLRMGVTNQRGPPSHGEVQILPPFGVPNAAASAAFEHRRVAIGDAVFAIGSCGKQGQGALGVGERGRHGMQVGGCGAWPESADAVPVFHLADRFVENVEGPVHFGVG